MKIFAILMTSLLLSCTSGEGDDEDTSPADNDGDDGAGEPGDSGAGGDGETEEEQISGTLSGTVTVQLYQDGDDGEREYISWTDAYEDVFPFGSIYVAAYYEDDEGGKHYVGDDVITSPSTTGDTFEIEASMLGEQELYIYAVLDYYQDNIVGTNEPKGVYTSAISFTDGTAAEGVDITILSPMYTGGGSCSTITISGDATITNTYNGGDVAVMLLDSAGNGPYHSATVTPTKDGGGASADYALTSCASYGSMILKGAWDKTGNGMFDPRDRWGAYILKADVNGNPITVGSTDMSGYEIQIPLGNEDGLSLVPFVRLSGTLSVQDGTLDDLPSGSTLYVAALKYRPNGQVSVTDLEDGYDLQVIENAEGSSVDWSVTVPADSIVYLWAYNDAENNGLVNESGEFVASGGEDDNGKLPTGSEGVSDIDMSLAQAEN